MLGKPFAGNNVVQNINFHVLIETPEGLLRAR